VTPEQTKLFETLERGIERLVLHAYGAEKLGLRLLAHNLTAIAKDLRESIAMQKRALVDENFTGETVRRGVCPTCKQPKENSINQPCPDRWHLWFCGAETCPGHWPGDLKQRC